MIKKRVFVYVQHLLGIGHLKRAAAIARAMAATGMEVTLASGGMPLPGLALDGVELVQLPPAVAADAGFKELLDGQGDPVDESWKQGRREALLGAWKNADPHALILELFPFGRRQMRFELGPLLDAATSGTRRPAIISSVRDILGGGQKNPARQTDMLALFDRYFDRLLVHSDPNVIPFEKTFLHTERLKDGDRLHYTGYVVDSARAQRSAAACGAAGEGEVVVSAGGGAVGYRLLDCAIRARLQSAQGARTWRILVGINAERAEFDRLSNLAKSVGAGRVIVEHARTDFTELLRNCAVSVSQGGYNTVMEVLQSQAKAVVVPFAGGAETEQTLRASILAERGMIDMLDDAALDPASLSAAIDRAAGRPRQSTVLVDLGGAEKSARLVSEWTSGLRW